MERTVDSERDEVQLRGNAYSQVQLGNKSTILILTTLLFSVLWFPDARGDVVADFECRYKEWQESLGSIIGFRSEVDIKACTDDNPAYRRLVALGIDLVPLALAKVKEDHWLSHVLCDVTKWRFHISRTGDPGQYVWTVEEFPSLHEPTGPPGAAALWDRWRTEFRRQVPERFSALYAEWQGLKKDGKSKEADEKFQRIKDLGIDVLPLLVEKVQKGDTDLIPAIAYLTDKKMPESATASECVSWWTANKEKWTLPAPEK